MTSNLTIAVDAMGGDNSPSKVIDGIDLHSKESLDIFYNIYGDYIGRISIFVFITFLIINIVKSRID